MKLDRWTVEEVVERLRSSGARLTTPRRAVIRALVEGEPHQTADDLADLVARRHPEVHKSTVYRTLDALADLGLVEHVHLGHGRAVYHLDGDDDLHLLCSSCGLVTHIPSSSLDSSRERIARQTGFVLEPGHFALPGLCAECRDPDSTSAE